MSPHRSERGHVPLPKLIPGKKNGPNHLQAKAGPTCPEAHRLMEWGALPTGRKGEREWTQNRENTSDHCSFVFTFALVKRRYPHL